MSESQVDESIDLEASQQQIATATSLVYLKVAGMIKGRVYGIDLAASHFTPSLF